MKYQVIIKNNETGEIVHEADTDCILFVAHGEEKTGAGLIGSCDTDAMLNVYKGTKDIYQKLKESIGLQNVALFEALLATESQKLDLLEMILNRAKKERNEETPES